MYPQEIGRIGTLISHTFQISFVSRLKSASPNTIKMSDDDDFMQDSDNEK